MLKTRLAPFVVSSALVLGSLGAAAKSSETLHALDGQNVELEETIDRELEQFRSAQVSLQQALLIAERLHTGSRVVDISFDGASNPSVYKVKNIQKDQIWENSIDARTGSSSAGGEHALSVKDLEAQDRRNLLALRAVRQELSDAVVVAERSTRGKAISGGLMNEDKTLYFVIVVDTADGLKQVLLEPPRVRGR
jgi:Peptidase propeptide and YPEB domain